MIWIILMLLGGICLSALFSGSETGFYRASRVRLVLDGVAGDSTARRLLWLTNNPALFVATTLVGNNVANYLTSLAIVLASQRLFHGNSVVAEILAPILLAPFLFVYGESLPKTLFLKAPNFLLHLTHPLFVFFGIAFSPVAAILWALGRGLEKLLGRAPETVRLALARKELEQVLREGHDAGILKPVQHELAQSLFSIAHHPIVKYAIPRARLRCVRRQEPVDNALKLGRKLKRSHVPVENKAGDLLGYALVSELRLSEEQQLTNLRPMMDVRATDTLCSVLIGMHTARVDIARVLDGQGRTVGVVQESDLSELLDVNFGSTR